MIRVYTRRYCGACKSLIALLGQKGVAFETIDLSDDDDAHERLIAQTGWETLPVIFIDDALIGGWDEIEELDDEGQLDLLLGIG